MFSHVWLNVCKSMITFFCSGWTIRLRIRCRVEPLVLLVSIVHIVLQVSLSAVLLILSIEERNMLLRILLVHMIEPQVKASKLISEILAEWNLHWIECSSLYMPSGIAGFTLRLFLCTLLLLLCSTL